MAFEPARCERRGSTATLTVAGNAMHEKAASCPVRIRLNYDVAQPSASPLALSCLPANSIYQTMFITTRLRSRRARKGDAQSLPSLVIIIAACRMTLY